MRDESERGIQILSQWWALDIGIGLGGDSLCASCGDHSHRRRSQLVQMTMSVSRAVVHLYNNGIRTVVIVTQIRNGTETNFLQQTRDAVEKWSSQMSVAVSESSLSSPVTVSDETLLAIRSNQLRANSEILLAKDRCSEAYIAMVIRYLL